MKKKTENFRSHPFKEKSAMDKICAAAPSVLFIVRLQCNCDDFIRMALTLFPVLVTLQKKLPASSLPLFCPFALIGFVELLAHAALMSSTIDNVEAQTLALS